MTAIAANGVGSPVGAPVGTQLDAARPRGPTLPATGQAAHPDRRRRGWLVALGSAGSLLLVATALLLRWSGPAKPAFRTVRVARADITERVAATGTLQPVVLSPVGAQVSGIVWKLHADFNSSVKAGQLLVELDPALFRNAVAVAAAQLSQAEASLEGALATRLGALGARDRIRTLERAALTSQADLDATEAVLGQQTGAARAGVAQVAQARAELERARLDLQHSIIRSPVDGTVISRNVDVGQAVAATLTAPTLFTIAQDLSRMLVHAAVDEADIGAVQAGQSATFTVDAFREKTFRAVVREVRNAPQTAQSVVTYDVVLDVENPEGKLRPGMTANVLILIVQRLQVEALPNEALRFRPVVAAGEGVGVGVGVGVGAGVGAGVGVGVGAGVGAGVGVGVYVPQEGRAVRVAVKLGATDGNLTEVEGLAAGREVIVDVVREKGRASPASGGGHGM